MNFFSRLKEGLAKTRMQISSILGGTRVFDDAFYETLEEALIAADIGLDVSLENINRLKERIQNDTVTTVHEAYTFLKEIISGDLAVPQTEAPAPGKPWIVLVVGVNGTGKTTTIGKIAQQYREQGKKVMLGAADTFRAGAIEQLRIWAERTGSEFVSQHEGADAASVAYDALEAAKARGADILILDTAGRLHNKTNLMNELEKIVRVLKRNTPTAPNETLLVLDATTGQNAIKQTEVFHKALGLTGLVITKLDGTAKGGIAIALVKKFGVPIKKIGVGEGLDDLQDFDPKAYVEAMLGEIGGV